MQQILKPTILPFESGQIVSFIFCSKFWSQQFYTLKLVKLLVLYFAANIKANIFSLEKCKVDSFILCSKSQSHKFYLLKVVKFFVSFCSKFENQNLYILKIVKFLAILMTPFWQRKSLKADVISWNEAYLSFILIYMMMGIVIETIFLMNLMEALALSVTVALEVSPGLIWSWYLMRE